MHVGASEELTKFKLGTVIGHTSGCESSVPLGLPRLTVRIIIVKWNLGPTAVQPLLGRQCHKMSKEHTNASVASLTSEFQMTSGSTRTAC